MRLWPCALSACTTRIGMNGRTREIKHKVALQKTTNSLEKASEKFKVFTAWIKSLLPASPEDKQDGWLQKKFRWLCMHPRFTQVFMCLILVNSVLMAVEYDGMSSAMEDALSNLNLVLSGAFAIEVAVKVCSVALAGCSPMLSLCLSTLPLDTEPPGFP